MNWKSKLSYYAGWILMPSCLILCIAEFLWNLGENVHEGKDPLESFYFMRCLNWFIRIGNKNDIK